MQLEQDASVAAVIARALSCLHGDDSRADAELLLAHALQQTRGWLYAHNDAIVPDLSLALFDEWIQRRAAGEPVAQLIGRQGFWTLDLRVTADVLIPRADTELLVERALGVLPIDQTCRVLDLGTGSGAIALAIASERKLAHITAVDSSVAALEVARSNVDASPFGARMQCLLGEWFSPVFDQRFDAIVSNPPYLAEHDPHLVQGDLRFEPRAALVSGRDGLDAIRAIVRDAPTYLLTDGWLMLEHGWEQGAQVRELLGAAGFSEVATHRDIEDRERVTCGCWRVATIFHSDSLAESPG